MNQYYHNGSACQAQQQQINFLSNYLAITQLALYYLYMALNNITTEVKAANENSSDDYWTEAVDEWYAGPSTIDGDRYYSAQDFTKTQG